MYPKVKVKDQDEFLQSLNDFESLSINDFSSPEYQDNSPPSTIKIPEFYIPISVISKVSDLKGTKKNDKKVNEDERPNIKASTIPRPRAVLSSPDNDGVIGNRNRLIEDRPSALKNHNLVQNRHAQCKVIPNHFITESPTSTRRKSKEAADRKGGFKGLQGSGVSVPSQKTSFRTGRPSSLRSQVL